MFCPSLCVYGLGFRRFAGSLLGYYEKHIFVFLVKDPSIVKTTTYVETDAGWCILVWGAWKAPNGVGFRVLGG